MWLRHVTLISAGRSGEPLISAGRSGEPLISAGRSGEPLISAGRRGEHSNTCFFIDDIKSSSHCFASNIMR
jgi:hypothetical protein